MIKFKSIFIIIGFFMSYYFQGQNISEETARMVANNFLNLKSENKRSLEVQLTNITAQINKKYNGFYIFKTATEKGFCIISSEKGNHPILAYSFDSPLSTNGPISPEFLYILDGYQAANEYLRKNKSKKIISEDNALIKKEWEDLLDGNSFSSTINAKLSQPESVKPLLLTTWNQSPKYNKFTPILNDKPTHTGCVATAMAQIMKFWNYPVKGKGTHTYTFSELNGKTLTADFENTTYLWDTMPNSLSSSTEPEIDAVATLMFHAGIAVNMKYGNESSLASDASAKEALIKHFKYNPKIEIIHQGLITDNDWLKYVKDQLVEGYPVYFSGRSSTGGHAFIADGYDANNLVHFNLGWGGHYDGYYQITNPRGYTGRQTILINIFPSAITCSTPTGLTTSNISDNSAILNWKVVNGAQNYTIEYKTASASTWTVANASINSNSFTLSGLVANTSYIWRVKANCQGSNTSDYSQANFKTILPAPCIENYEPNDSFTASTPILTNTEYSAGINSASDKDYYKFTLNNKSNVTITLQNLPKNYELFVYNSSKAQIGKSTNGGNTNESITLNYLVPGTYYVYVYGASGAFDITQCYNLKVEETVIAPCIENYEPNDSFTASTPIPTNTEFSAGIGSTSDKDYYKFILDNNSNVTINLQDLSKNYKSMPILPKFYNFIVYNSSKEQIGLSSANNTTNEFVTLNNLKPGTYYVVVEGYNGYFDITQCYKLKVEAITLAAPCIANYEPNDSFAQATAINTNTNYSAGIGSSADKDYYKFTLNSKSNVTVTLQNLPKNYELIVYNSSNAQIGKSTNGGNTNESITLNYLDPGTYYVMVYGYNGYFDIIQCYNLKIEAAVIAPCIANYEPNDSFAQATTISTNTNYSAGIGSATDKDYYKFTLYNWSNINVTLKDLPKDYNLVVYNSSKAQIAKSVNGGFTNESVTLNYLEPGTYYVVVEGYNGNYDINRCYTLKAEATAIASCVANYEPNDSFAQATAINTNTNYSAGIGTITDKDYYKFTLNNWSNINVTLKDLPKDYNLVLYNSSKAQIAKSVNGGTTNESVTLNYLEPGTYYVVVEGYNGNFDITQCYTLKAEATAIASCVANYEPNDSFAQATSIQSNIDYSAGIGSASDKDYYNFILNSKSNVTVTLQNLPKDYNFIIFNSSYKKIGKSTRKKKLNKLVFSKTLKPDTYYVQVYGEKGDFDINQCYTLKVEGNYITYKNVNISDTLLDNEISNTENNNSVLLYPNPVEDIINIKGVYSDKNEHTNLTIYDRNGRIVKNFPIKIDNIISINVSDLSPNVYYLNIKGKNYKFIKK
ncbi:C10 family peptidase [Apibacter adventoris]|uniref:C10 family peptidase n=1 Tax=Apibacter adventoris TaxID=1679466 RepID=UPI000CF6EBA2|nr:C10 family peptidase [Apibacter adventoris]PQL94037.1 hypothetical protein C4S76_06595 [Apibacter adventoris]